MNTMSHPGTTVVRRLCTASRRSLLIRFRTTALPSRRLTENPNRVSLSPRGNLHKTNIRLAQDRPSPCTRRKSSDLVRRYLAGNTTTHPAVNALLALPVDRVVPLYGQHLAPTSTPRIEHFAPASSRHPRQKPVNSHAAPLFRLPCSLGRHLDLLIAPRRGEISTYWVDGALYPAWGHIVKYGITAYDRSSHSSRTPGPWTGPKHKLTPCVTQRRH